MGSGTPHCQQGCDKEASSSVDIVFLHIHTPYLPCSYHPDHELCTKFNTECIYTSTIKKINMPRKSSSVSSHSGYCVKHGGKVLDCHLSIV